MKVINQNIVSFPTLLLFLGSELFLLMSKVFLKCLVSPGLMGSSLGPYDWEGAVEGASPWAESSAQKEEEDGLWAGFCPHSLEGIFSFFTE